MEGLVTSGALISHFAPSELNLATVDVVIGSHAVTLIPMAGKMVKNAQQMPHWHSSPLHKEHAQRQQREEHDL